MKKRTISLMLGILAVMMLVGVGFATWVITQGASTAAEGQINVEVVKDERLDVTYTFASGKENFAFGFKADSSVENPWLTSNNDTPENLVVELSVKVTRHNTANPFSDASEQETHKPVVTLNDALKKAESSNILVSEKTDLFKLVSITVADGTYDGTDNSLNYAVVVTLQWGDAVSNTNPYTFFNKLGNVDAAVSGFTTQLPQAEGEFYNSVASLKLADAAYLYLHAMEALSSYTFTLDIAVA